MALMTWCNVKGVTYSVKQAVNYQLTLQIVLSPTVCVLFGF